MAPIGYETLNSRNAKRVGGDTPNPPSLPPPSAKPRQQQ